jgi:hypothetical protein
MLIAERAGLAPGEANRHSVELRDKGLVRFVTIGPTVSLTREGLELVERQDEEKKLSAKVGRAASRAKPAAVWIGQKMLVGVGGVIITAITGSGLFLYFREGIVKWVRLILGLD